MMISVNTDIFHPAANPFAPGAASLQGPHESTHTSFNLQDVLASQAPGHQAITAGVNQNIFDIYGGWTHLLGYGGNPQDVANAANANYAAEHSASRITAAQVTAQGSGLSFWQQLKANLFGAALKAGR